MVTAKQERNHKALEKIVCEIPSFAALHIPPVRQSTPSKDDKDHEDNEEVEDDEDGKDEKDHDDKITSEDNDVHEDNEDDDICGNNVGAFINEVEGGVPSTPHSLFIKQLLILNQTPTYQRSVNEKDRVIYCVFPGPVSVNYWHWPVGILVYHFGITSVKFTGTGRSVFRYSHRHQDQPVRR